MPLAHITKAAEIIRDRDAARKAAEEQRRAEAEALFQRCVLSEQVEADVVEQLVEATDLLGRNWRELEREGSITTLIPGALKELNEFEMRYHEAVEKLARLEAHYQRNVIPEGDLREHQVKAHLCGAESALRHWKEKYTGRLAMLNTHIGHSRYRRRLPTRYTVSIDYLIDNYLPPRRDPESGEVIPGERRVIFTKPMQVKQETGNES